LLLEVMIVGPHFQVVFVTVAIVIRVYQPDFINLVEHIVDFQHVAAYQLATAVNGERDRFRGTVLVSGIVDGLENALRRSVEDVDVVLRVDLILFEVLLYHVVASSFGLMDDDGLVVGVVLVEDRVESKFIGKAIENIESLHYDAEGQLLRKLLKVVLLAQSFILVVFQLVITWRRRISKVRLNQL
jgi:hypothetical protein